MANFYSDNEDLQFYVSEWIDWEPLVQLTEYDFKAPEGFTDTQEALVFYEQLLDLVGGFVAKEIAPKAAAIDRQGLRFDKGTVYFPPELDAIFEQIKGLELHGMCVPRELGGMNCPLLLYLINTEIFSRADVSIAAHHGFHGGIAMALLFFSIQEGTTTFDPESRRIVTTRFADAIREILAGDAWGSMDITEPQAGSDMAALRTRAELDETGEWTVTGQKIFITSGHGKYHCVIARTEDNVSTDDPLAGLAGLSMFLVPTSRRSEDGTEIPTASFGRIEEKLGHHASATVVVDFDRTPAHLIGKRGEGFKYMLIMMNNARVGVGFECIGLCEAAYRLARDYAAERRSMGKALDRHELIADLLDEMEVDLVALRALAMHGAYQEEMARKKALAREWLDDERVRPTEEEIKRHRRRARRVTPLVKYLAAEKAVEMARRSVQILGGVGYTKEYGAEKLLRDAIVMPIYEGTSQIQALMTMKDALAGVMKRPQDFVRRVAQARWRGLSEKDPLVRRVAKLQGLALSAQQTLLRKTAMEKLGTLQGVPLHRWLSVFTKDWDPKRDFVYAKLHAERLTRILTDVAVAELLLAQAQRFPKRRTFLKRYLDRAEPRSRFLLDEINTERSDLLDRLSDDPPVPESA